MEIDHTGRAGEELVVVESEFGIPAREGRTRTRLTRRTPKGVDFGRFVVTVRPGGRDGATGRLGTSLGGNHNGNKDGKYSI